MKRYAIIGGLVLVLVWGWLSAFSWFDASALCRIHIDVELLEGDRASIKQAIAVVRTEDPLAYRDLCRWVDRIQEERHCQAGDPQADPRLRGQENPATRLRERAEGLKRMAGHARAFWTGAGR